MSNFREVNDDILKDWLLFREDELSSLTCEEDRKHWVYFDEISKKILNSIPKQNRAFVQKQLNVLDDNFLDYNDSNHINLLKFTKTHTPKHHILRRS